VTSTEPAFRRRTWTAAAALAVVAWRIALEPRSAWRDVPALLAVLGSVLALDPSASRRRLAVLSGAAYLVGLYVARQSPRILELFR
jgi:hypothetical protein